MKKSVFIVGILLIVGGLYNFANFAQYGMSPKSIMFTGSDASIFLGLGGLLFLIGIIVTVIGARK